MTAISQSFVNDYKKSKHILVLLNKYLPLQLALWLPIIVNHAKSIDKEISVLVTDESSGWGWKIDKHFPVDMILDIEKFKQKIVIPFTGNKEEIDNVLYNVTDSSIEISLTPNDSKLLLEKLETKSSGANYDLVLGVGVNANHSLNHKIADSKASLAGASSYMIGTFSLKTAFENKLPYLNGINVISEGISRFLIQTIDQLNISSTEQYKKNVIPNILALMYTFQFNPYSKSRFEKDAYRVVNTLGIDDSVLDTASRVFSLDGSKEDSILKVFLKNITSYSDGDAKLYKFSSEDLSAVGATKDEVIVCANLIPLSDSVTNSLILVQESEKINHVNFVGKNSIVRKVAQRYGFAMTDNHTVGTVNDTYTSKFIMDIMRIITGQDVPEEDDDSNMAPLPQEDIASAQYLPEVEENNINDSSTSDVEDVIVSPNIPNQSDGMKIPETESSSEEVLQNLEEATLADGVSNIVTPPENIPSSVSSNVPVSSGLDFASIAQKMKESQ